MDTGALAQASTSSPLYLKLPPTGREPQSPILSESVYDAIRKGRASQDSRRLTTVESDVSDCKKAIAGINDRLDKIVSLLQATPLSPPSAQNIQDSSINRSTTISDSVPKPQHAPEVIYSYVLEIGLPILDS